MHVLYIFDQSHKPNVCKMIAQSPAENQPFLLLLLYGLEINTISLYNELIPSGDFVVFS